MKEKNGFTLIELLGVIIILGILIALAVSGYSRYLNGSKSKAFKIEEANFVGATKGAYTDCFSNNTNNNFCKSHKIFNTEDEYVYLKELISDGYIEIIKNPYNTNEFCDIEKSYVHVSMNNNTQSNNIDMLYKVCLICGDHKSKDCIDN